MPSLDELLSRLLDVEPGGIGEIREIQERIEEKLALVDEALAILEPAVLAGARLEEDAWILDGEEVPLPVLWVDEELDEIESGIVDAQAELRHARATLKRFESLAARIATLVDQIATRARRELDEQGGALDEQIAAYKRYQKRYDELDP